MTIKGKKGKYGVDQKFVWVYSITFCGKTQMNFLANPVFEGRHPSDENILDPQSAKFRPRRQGGNHSRVSPTGLGSQPRLWGRWVTSQTTSSWQLGRPACASQRHWSPGPPLWEGPSSPREGIEFSAHGGSGSAFTHPSLSCQILSGN